MWGDASVGKTDTIYWRRFGVETSRGRVGHVPEGTRSRCPALVPLPMGVAALLHTECVTLELLWASEGRPVPKGSWSSGGCYQSTIGPTTRLGPSATGGESTSRSPVLGNRLTDAIR